MAARGDICDAFSYLLSVRYSPAWVEDPMTTWAMYLPTYVIAFE
jgi:hypothetical protein